MPEVADRARLVIRLTAFIMVLAFGWLQLGREDVGRALSGSSPEVLLRVSLALYYLAWVAGTTNDTNEQEQAYTTAPSRRAVTTNTIAAALSLGGAFGALCLVDSARAFAVVLAGFLVLNVAWWQILSRRLVRGVIASSAKRLEAENDFIGLIMLENMTRYIAGEWQWWRFAAGSVMVAAILAVAFFGIPAPLLRYPLLNDQDRALGVMVLIYVVGFEAWIWVERLRLGVSRGALAALRGRFVLMERTNSGD